jgi:hypothetical protein
MESIPHNRNDDDHDNRPASAGLKTGQRDGRHREPCMGDLGALGPMESAGGQGKGEFLKWTLATIGLP